MPTAQHVALSVVRRAAGSAYLDHVAPLLVDHQAPGHVAPVKLQVVQHLH